MLSDDECLIAARAWASAYWEGGTPHVEYHSSTKHAVLCSIGNREWLVDDDLQFMTDGNTAIRVSRSSGEAEVWSLPS